MEFTNPKFGKCVIEKFPQKKAESLIGLGVENKEMSLVKYHGLLVAEAMRLGVITEPKIAPEVVCDQDPGLVRWLAEKLAEALQDALSIPPDSSSPPQTMRKGEETPQTS